MSIFARPMSIAGAPNVGPVFLARLKLLFVAEKTGVVGALLIDRFCAIRSCDLRIPKSVCAAQSRTRFSNFYVGTAPQPKVGAGNIIDRFSSWAVFDSGLV
jgi:hypothetical protein